MKNRIFFVQYLERMLSSKIIKQKLFTGMIKKIVMFQLHFFL